MAFFDSDKRPRGLRVPSLGRKTKPAATASVPVPQPVQPVQPASSQAAVPVQAAPAQQMPPTPLPAEKRLPPSPLPSPPEYRNRPFAPTQASYTGHSTQASYAGPPTQASYTGPTRSLPRQQQPATPPEEPPLEDFIPDPESDSTGTQTPAEPSTLTPEQSENDSNGGDAWLPPQPEPIAAPLGKVHFECFTAHRTMHPSNNVWYAVPCMTCLKQDREVRHRCVFCCLRVCATCYDGLLKCENRSLAAFVAS
ncbi:hypothetical protein ASPZODRAFT_67357 [Penicilliopsis zonata CBS 506.65]|uniref:Uncharacterized protein n=1 Tax=Penicilliopsis zonata CBS 506.65 TaxID=1073090 RepID=A0A1L9SG94_9EURO|nr:hypothetical protein ASPZODRAFT_67357 [Penicilliopsis zonata CBS 506.65]OJJ46295.1 hypothetical protein ASPZODRAFT_67357 [Penicilliopsis zonata CBS 506.65]